MKKFSKLLLALLLPLTVNAQDLITKIPADASTVVKINTSNFFNFLTKEYYYNPTASMLKAINNKHATEPENLKKLGIDTSLSTYYFNQRTDSINYDVMLMHLQDASKLDNYWNKNEIVRKGDLRKKISSDSSSIILWNESSLYIITAEINSSFFIENSITHKKYGIDLSYLGYTSTIPHQLTKSEKTKEKEYNKKISAAEKKTKILQYNWLEAKAEQIYYNNYASINTDKSYTKNIANNSIAYVWTKDLENLSYKNFKIPAVPRKFLPTDRLLNLNLFGPYKSVSANLLLDNTSFKIELATETNEIDDKIYDHKLNEKFLDYIDTDEDIVAFSYSINNKAFANILARYFTNARYDKKHYDEATDISMVIYLEFLSLFTDREAFNKIFTGDLLYVINSLYNEQVKYLEYSDYDKEGRSKLIGEKQKTVISPNFLFMMSTENVDFVKRLFATGINKGLLSKINNDIYQLKNNNRFELYNKSANAYLLIKDSIIFCSNSKDKLEKINNNKYDINNSNRDIFKYNNFTAFYNDKKLPSGTFSDDIKVTFLEDILRDMNRYSIKSSVINKNSITLEVNNSKNFDAEQNGINYLFNLLNTEY